MRLLTLVLWITGAAYAVRGYQFLLTHGNPTDMYHRVHGLAHLVDGRTPYFKGPGKLISAPDAPWGWLGNAVLYWPPKWYVNWWYGVIAGGIIALVTIWGWRQARPLGKELAWLSAASSFCISGWCTCLGLGQNTPAVVGLLVASLWLAERKSPILSGICLGAAMVKPNIAVLFVLPFVVTSQWLVLISSAVYGCIALAIVCAVRQAGPITMIGEWIAHVHRLGAWPGHGPWQILRMMGFSTPHSLSLCAAFFLGLAVLLCVRYRRRGLLTLFAVAAVAGRLWTYHQLYDNVMLLFLLVALLVSAIEQRDWKLWTAFVVVGIGLWAPGRTTTFGPFPYFQMVTWLGGLGLLLRKGARPSEVVSSVVSGRDQSPLSTPVAVAEPQSLEYGSSPALPGVDIKPAS